jgi:hypothetical protein
VFLGDSFPTFPILFPTFSKSGMRLAGVSVPRHTRVFAPYPLRKDP